MLHTKSARAARTAAPSFCSRGPQGLHKYDPMFGSNPSSLNELRRRCPFEAIRLPTRNEGTLWKHVNDSDSHRTFLRFSMKVKWSAEINKKQEKETQNGEPGFRPHGRQQWKTFSLCPPVRLSWSATTYNWGGEVGGWAIRWPRAPVACLQPAAKLLVGFTRKYSRPRRQARPDLQTCADCSSQRPKSEKLSKVRGTQTYDRGGSP